MRYIQRIEFSVVDYWPNTGLLKFRTQIVFRVMNSGRVLRTDPDIIFSQSMAQDMPHKYHSQD
jgi:hypothetical protein